MTDAGLSRLRELRCRRTIKLLGESRTRGTGGVGLGLSIVAHLVRVLGGSISVVSEVDRGSTFRVELPVRFVATVEQPMPLAAAS